MYRVVIVAVVVTTIILPPPPLLLYATNIRVPPCTSYLLRILTRLFHLNHLGPVFLFGAVDLHAGIDAHHIGAAFHPGAPNHAGTSDHHVVPAPLVTVTTLPSQPNPNHIGEDCNSDGIDSIASNIIPALARIVYPYMKSFICFPGGLSPDTCWCGYICFSGDTYISSSYGFPFPTCTVFSSCRSHILSHLRLTLCQL